MHRFKSKNNEFFRMKVKKSPRTALFPCPVVLVTSVGSSGKPNIITIAWVGTVCSDPPMLSVSIRPPRYSCKSISDSGEFVVNIPTETILRQVDFCGMVSGKTVDKFAETGLTPESAAKVKAPLIKECPVNIECVVKNQMPLGAHRMFLGEIVQVHVDKEILDETGKIDFNKAVPFVYNEGEYWSRGEKIGLYGFSVSKKK